MLNLRTIVIMLAALLIAIITFVGITIHNSDAQEQKTCPSGSVLSADGTACIAELPETDADGDGVNENVTTTTSCLQGVLSDDGKTCIVPRLDAPAPAGAGAADQAPVPIFTG